MLQAALPLIMLFSNGLWTFPLKTNQESYWKLKEQKIWDIHSETKRGLQYTEVIPSAL